MRFAMLAVFLVVAAAPCASAQSSEGDAVGAEPKTLAPSKTETHSTVERRRCPPAGRRAACAKAKNAVAVGSAVTVVAPVEAPMLPPLGGHVWLHEDPPLFDPYASAGPWYKPWVHEGTNVVQWRYGFPGGHVDWFRGLGWRPGFGWF
jgi:hypothetical protein